MATISTGRSSTAPSSTARSTIDAVLAVADAEGLHLPGRAEPVLAGLSVGSLAVDGRTVWVLCDRSELYRVTPDEPAERVATLRHGTATCVHVHDGTVFVGGDDAALWRLGDGTL